MKTFAEKLNSSFFKKWKVIFMDYVLRGMFGWDCIGMGEIKPYNCSIVKTPTALKLKPSYVLNLLCLTTIIILCLFCRIRFATCPMDVVVVTPGGGLLIIFQRGASNCIINKYLLLLYTSTIIRLKYRPVVDIARFHSWALHKPTENPYEGSIYVIKLCLPLYQNQINSQKGSVG